MTNHKYKLLAIDIDGTLINRQGDVSAENREALAMARSSGIQVSLCTGRSVKSSMHVIDQLLLDGHHIFFDGALVSTADPGKEIYAQPIEKTIVRQMVEYAHAHDIDLELHSSTHYFAERETWSTEAHRRFFGGGPAMEDFDRLCEQERIIKGGLALTTPREAAMAEDFGNHFAASLYFSRVQVPKFPEVTFVNILAPDTSKGAALKALAAYLGISLTEVAAAGDGKNDISLLSAAGLGIAMGNAHDELKKIADHITLDEEHGLAAAIKQLLL